MTFVLSKPQRNVAQPFVVVGCLIGDDRGRILLIQEDGMWNHPAGWLELGESLVAGAVREAQEETGYEVAAEGLLGVYTLVKYRPDKTLHAVKFIFRSHIIGKSTESQENLISQWFTPQEIQAMSGKLRDADLIHMVEDWMQGISYPLTAVGKITAIQQS